MTKASDIQKFIALGNINKDGVIKHGAKNPEDRSFERIGINKLKTTSSEFLDKNGLTKGKPRHIK